MRIEEELTFFCGIGIVNCFKKICDYLVAESVFFEEIWVDQLNEDVVDTFYGWE